MRGRPDSDGGGACGPGFDNLLGTLARSVPRAQGPLGGDNHHVRVRPQNFKSIFASTGASAG